MPLASHVAVPHANSLYPQVAGCSDTVRAVLAESDPEGLGYISGDGLEAALTAAGLKFTPHQAISLRRRLDRERTGSVLTDDVLAALGLAGT